MSAARTSPYVRLRDDASEFARAVVRANRIRMWHYPKDQLGPSWSLAELWERVAAADQLGYRVELCATPEGLIVEYVKRPPPPPWQLAP